MVDGTHEFVRLCGAAGSNSQAAVVVGAYCANGLANKELRYSSLMVTKLGMPR